MCLQTDNTHSNMMPASLLRGHPNNSHYLSVPYGLLSQKKRQHSQARITEVPIYTFKDQNSRLLDVKNLQKDVA